MTVSPELLTVPEAATVAGVSVRTMRRWASSGQVRTTGSGHRRRVVAASLSEVAATNGQNGHDVVTRDRPVSATTDTGSASAANSDTNGHEADRLAALVRELSERLAAQTGLTAMWQERARVLAGQLALAAPEASQAPQDANPGPAVPAPTTDAPVSILARLRALAPWLVAVLAIAAMIVLLVVRPG